MCATSMGKEGVVTKAELPVDLLFRATQVPNVQNCFSPFSGGQT